MNMTTCRYDPAVRALIAREVAAAEQRGAERVAQAVERARKVLDGWEHDGPDGYEFHLLIRRVREALELPLDHDFLPVQGHPDDDECTHREDGTDATYCGRTEAEHRDERPAPELPKWADLFGAAPGINLCGEPDEVTEGELRAIIRNAISLNDPAATARWMRDHLHITRRAR